MSMLKRVIRTAVISALGAKLAKGRSPLVAALLTLLATRVLSGREEAAETTKTGSEAGGLGGLVDKFRQGGLEEIIKSWIGTGPNKSITPAQLQQALGPQAVDDLARQSEMPRDDLLSQLARLLPEIIDRLTPEGKLPPPQGLDCRAWRGGKSARVTSPPSHRLMSHHIVAKSTVVGKSRRAFGPETSRFV